MTNDRYMLISTDMMYEVVEGESCRQWHPPLMRYLR